VKMPVAYKEELCKKFQEQEEMREQYFKYILKILKKIAK
jgi:hypothetical protein